MWDDCIGPLAPPDVPNKENKEAAASTSAIKVEKKPEFMTKFLGKKCQCGACCDAGVCLQGLEWEDCMGPVSKAQVDGRLVTESSGRPTHVSDDGNGGKIICIGIACGPKKSSNFQVES